MFPSPISRTWIDWKGPSATYGSNKGSCPDRRSDPRTPAMGCRRWASQGRCRSSPCQLSLPNGAWAVYIAADMSELPEAILSKAATIARGLAIDAVHASQSGHLGLPLGCAEIGAVLFGHALRHCPAHPEWLNRDRFVLSAGHGSMFLYAWLHLSGYRDMTLDEIKRFRQLDSKTPGHPELTHAPSGVETTTGPLGQGVAQRGRHGGRRQDGRGALQHRRSTRSSITTSSASPATAACRKASRWRRVEFAGHQKLDNLILIYDSNAVTLDAMAKETQSEDTAKRFEAHRLRRADGRRPRHGRVPRRVRAREERRAAASRSSSSPRRSSARASPRSRARRRRTAKAARSSPTPRARASGLPAEHFYVSPEVQRVLRGAREGARRRVRRVGEDVRRLEGEEPEARRGARGVARVSRTRSPQDTARAHARRRRRCFAAIPEFPADTKIATRKAGQDVLQPLAAKIPLLIGGSADLYGSTLNYIGDLKTGDDDFKPGHRAGRNIRFGIREHGMCSILNGIAAHGIFRPSGATFLVFADYCRAADPPRGAQPPAGHLHLHARQRRRRRRRPDARAGRDHPRPARDPEPRRHPPGRSRRDGGRVRRRARAHRRPDAARAHAPGRAAARRHPGRRRAAKACSRAATSPRRRPAPLDLILLSAGSELQHALKAAETLGAGNARRQHAVLRALRPPARRVPRGGAAARVPRAASPSRRPSRRRGRATSASTASTIGIDRFGMSAPGAEVMKELGMTAEHVVSVAKALAAR